MENRLPVLAMVVWLFAASTEVSAGLIELHEFAIHVDGVLSEPTAFGDPIPANVDVSGFDVSSGLGSITMMFTDVGSHTAIVYLDHEIDQGINTYFNEIGSATGSPATGQMWEIDEPFLQGDIFDNVSAGVLDNSIGVSPFGNTSFPDDVAMALGYQFDLAAGETAVLEFGISTVMPAGGFFLAHSDPESAGENTLYFSSSIDVMAPMGPPTDPDPIPEPSTIALLGIGVAVASATRLRRKQRARRSV